MKHTIFATLLIASLIYSTPRITVATLATATPIETQLTAPDASPSKQFARAVAIDGDTAVIGAPTSFIGAEGFWLSLRLRADRFRLAIPTKTHRF